MMVFTNGKVRENSLVFRSGGLLTAAFSYTIFAVMSGLSNLIVLFNLSGGALLFSLIFWAIPMGLFSIKCFKNAYGLYSRARMTYEITKDGFVLQFPHEAVQIIPWYTFQDTCICYIGYTSSRSSVRGAAVGIVLALPTAKKDRHGRWSSNDPSHYRDAIMFDYTEELHKEFIEKCPRKLIDRRMEKEYML